MAFGNNETGGHLPVNPKPEGPALAFGRSSLTQGLVFAQDYNPGSWGSTHKDLLGASSGAYTGTSANRGPFGWERTFLSSTDVDNYTSGPAVNGLTTLSVEFIFKANTDTFSTIFGKGSNASVADGQIFFCVNYDDTSHCISIGAGYNTTSIGFHDTGANFPANQFTHCVATWDATTLLSPLAAIYKNGQSLALTQEGTGAAGTRVTDNTALQVGNFPTQNFGATADIVYLRVWNRVLLPAEVRALAQNPWIVYRQPSASTATNLPTASVDGSVAVTEGNDTFAATGSVLVSGAVAVTEGNDNLAATGSVIVSGAGALLEIQDSFAATGTVTQPAVSGSAALLELQDSFAAIGNNGLADSHEPGILDHSARFISERKRRAKLREQVVDAFERIVEGKPELSPEIADEIVSEIEARHPDMPMLDMTKLLQSQERLQSLWNGIVDRDDEDVLVLL